MVNFNEDNTFTLSIEGCNKVYIDTMKALIGCLSNSDDNYISNNDRYSIANLLDSMLPNPEQIISNEDVRLLRVAKQNTEEVIQLIKNEDNGQN